MESRRAAVAKQISAAKKSLRDEERDADKHVKIALGGAVLVLFAQENCPATIRHFLLTKADQGVQKQGLGREKFNRLLKYLPTTGKLTLAMVIYPLAASEKWLVGLPRKSTVCHKRYQSSISAVC